MSSLRCDKLFDLTRRLVNARKRLGVTNINVATAMTRVESWNTLILEGLNLLPTLKSIGEPVKIEEKESKSDSISSKVIQAQSDFLYALLVAFIYKWTPLRNYTEIAYTELNYRNDEKLWLLCEKMYFAINPNLQERKEAKDYFNLIRNGTDEYLSVLKQLEINRGFYGDIDALVQHFAAPEIPMPLSTVEAVHKSAIEAFAARVDDSKTEDFVVGTDFSKDSYLKMGEALAFRYRELYTLIAKNYYLNGDYVKAREIFEDLVTKRFFDSDFFDAYITFCEASFEPDLVKEVKLTQALLLAEITHYPFEVYINASKLDVAIAAALNDRSEKGLCLKIASHPTSIFKDWGTFSSAKRKFHQEQAAKFLGIEIKPSADEDHRCDKKAKVLAAVATPDVAAQPPKLLFVRK